MQKIIITGNLGRDPEMRYTPSGVAVTNMNVATNRTWKDANGEKHKETTWFKIAVWGKQAEPCNQYLKKGSLVYVEGELTPDPKTGGPRIWKKQDGSDGASFEIKAHHVEFLSSKNDDSNGPASDDDYDEPGVPAGVPSNGNADDIPF